MFKLFLKKLFNHDFCRNIKLNLKTISIFKIKLVNISLGEYFKIDSLKFEENYIIKRDKYINIFDL